MLKRNNYDSKEKWSHYELKLLEDHYKSGKHGVPPELEGKRTYNACCIMAHSMGYIKKSKIQEDLRSLIAYKLAKKPYPECLVIKYGNNFINNIAWKNKFTDISSMRTKNNKVNKFIVTSEEEALKLYSKGMRGIICISNEKPSHKIVFMAKEKNYSNLEMSMQQLLKLLVLGYIDSEDNIYYIEYTQLNHIDIIKQVFDYLVNGTEINLNQDNYTINYIKRFITVALESDWYTYFSPNFE